MNNHNQHNTCTDCWKTFAVIRWGDRWDVFRYLWICYLSWCTAKCSERDCHSLVMTLWIAYSFRWTFPSMSMLPLICSSVISLVSIIVNWALIIIIVVHCWTFDISILSQMTDINFVELNCELQSFAQMMTDLITLFHSHRTRAGAIRNIHRWMNRIYEVNVDYVLKFTHLSQFDGAQTELNYPNKKRNPYRSGCASSAIYNVHMMYSYINFAIYTFDPIKNFFCSQSLRRANKKKTNKYRHQ